MQAFLQSIQQNATNYAINAVVLACFVTVIAYLKAPRAKVLVFSFPVPFTCAYLATAMRIDPTNIAGMCLMLGYHWMVLYLHVRFKLRVLVAIPLCATGYVAGATLFRPLTEMQWLFIPMMFVWVAGWCVFVRFYRPAAHAAQPKTAPWWIKLPAVTAIAFFIFCLKDLLAGAVATFPYAGVFTSYEMRHNLRTLAGQFSINVIGMMGMLLTIRTMQQMGIGEPWPLLGGWLTVIPLVGAIYWLGLGRPVRDAAVMD
jgi:hypothetical protein